MQKASLVVRYRRGNPRETVTPVIRDSAEMWALVAEAARDTKVASVRLVLEAFGGEVELFERG